MTTNKLESNPNVFYYKHNDTTTGEVTEVFIDFQQVVTFCRTGKENGSDVKIAVKYVNHSKAQFSFPSQEPYVRLCEEWNNYLNTRNEMKELAKESAKFLVEQIREEMKDEIATIVGDVVKEVQDSINLEIKKFRETVVTQAKEITDTALSHQKEINAENKKHLEHMKKLQDTSVKFVADIEDFSNRMESVVKVVNSVAPSADSLIQLELENIEKMNEEVSQG